MRRFIDLHLKPEFKVKGNAETLLARASNLGYRCVGVSLPLDGYRKILSALKERCSDLDLDFVSRIDLQPPNSRALLNALRRVRRTFEIVAVTCLSKPVARQAAKDRRVDLLNFPSYDPRRRFFDKAEAELTSNSFASLEIDMSPLLTLHDHQLARFLSTLRREVRIAREFDVKVIISSGAQNTFLMRQPRDYVSLARLFDLDKDSALDTLSENPKSIIERNRRKLSPNYVAPGVYIVGRRSDG